MTDHRFTSEFLERYGDAIDDRVTDTLDEYLRERAASARRHGPALLVVTVALSTVSLIAWHSAAVLARGLGINWARISRSRRHEMPPRRVVKTVTTAPFIETRQPARARQLGPAMRWGRLVAATVAITLVPWCVLLGATLPRTFHAQNWSLAWVGLDAGIAAAAATTAVLLRRGDIRAALTASATGTLLLVDSWFDTCTSAPGLNHAVAVLEAGFVEVPLSIGAFWLASAALRRQTR